MAEYELDPDYVVPAYHATFEDRLEAIIAHGLVAGSDEEAEPDDPEAVYLWGEEGEAVSFCEEWGRDTIVIVDVCDLDSEPDPEMMSIGFGGAYEFEATDYWSAFRVLGSICPERILDSYPSSIGTRVPSGSNRNGKPRRLYGEDGG